MTPRTPETSPQAYARVGGLLYLYIIVAALFAEGYVRAKLIVSSDAAATANNVLAHETLFRIGSAGDLLNVTFDVAVALILYVLLRPVDRNLALLAAFLRLATDIILAAGLIMEFVGIRILADSGFPKGFDPQQVQALAMLAFKLHASSYIVSLVFFGFALIILGYLIFRSGYLPRFLGVLLAVAGAGYEINSFARYVAPPVADALYPWTLLPGFVAELALCLWLLAKGVNLAGWRERVGGGN